MRPKSVTVTGVAASNPIPIDYRAENFGVGIGVKITGTATYTVQHTFDDIYNVLPANWTWFDHDTLAAKTANDDGNYAYPVRAVRLNVTASTGSVTMYVIPNQ